MGSTDLPMAMGFRIDGGWSPVVRGLVGAQIRSDDDLNKMILFSMTPDELRSSTAFLSAIVATLLVEDRWSDIETFDDFLACWESACARLQRLVDGDPPA